MNKIPFGMGVSDTQAGGTALLGGTAEIAFISLKFVEFVLIAKGK